MPHILINYLELHAKKTLQEETQNIQCIYSMVQYTHNIQQP